MRNIYRVDLENISIFTKEEQERFKRHNIDSFFPVWACVVLYFITFGLFILVYFGIKHGKLPRLKKDDPTTARAIGFMFIPFFNIYWHFFYWLRLVDRINFQYRLRGKKDPINRTFVYFVLSSCFFASGIGLLVLMPILIGKIQSASNKLIIKQ